MMNSRQRQAQERKEAKRKANLKQIEEHDILLCLLRYKIDQQELVKQEAIEMGYEPDAFYTEFKEYYNKWRNRNGI